MLGWLLYTIFVLVVAILIYFEYFGSNRCPRCNSPKTLRDVNNKKVMYCWDCDYSWKDNKNENS